jgi:hypothetical protein
MSDERRRLAEAEAALRDALRLVPSSRLQARVAADLKAAGPPRSAPWLGWVAAAAVGAGMMALASVPRGGEPAAATEPSEPTQEPRPSPAPLPPPSVSEPRSATTSRRPARRAAVRAAVGPPEEAGLPEVIVAPGQEQGLRELADRLADGAVPIPPSLVADGRPTVEEPPILIEALGIPPLRVSVLPSGSADEAEPEARSDS